MRERMYLGYDFDEDIWRSDGDPMVRFMGVSWCFVEAQNYAVFVEGVVLSSF